MDQATEQMLKELGRFAGEWAVEAMPPGGPPWPGDGRVNFEWTEGRTHLIQRWLLDLPDPPEGVPTNGTSIIGLDAPHGTYVQLYWDNRGVHRIYQMGLSDGEWTLRRDAPPFAQRFAARFSADGRTIEGRWEIDEGDGWRTDFDVAYSRTT